MKALMFGWEFPPHILGGLGTASYGLTQGMWQCGDMDITFVIPKPYGDEDRHFANIIGASQVPVAWRDVSRDYVEQRIGNVMNPDLYFALRDHIYADFNYMRTNDLGCIEFSGRYPDNLLEEINNYSIMAGVVARTIDCDIIHSHDWLTYPAGIHAKQVTGKPLVIHVHATDFDRSRGNVNPTVFNIELDGMHNADHIITVSDLTRRTVIEKYGIDPEIVEGKYLYYHSKNTSDVQVSVYRRLAVREVAEALEMYVAAGGVLTPDDELPDELNPDSPDDTEDDIPDNGDTDTELPDNTGEEPSLFITVLEAVIMFFEMIISFITGLFG